MEYDVLGFLAVMLIVFLLFGNWEKQNKENQKEDEWNI